MDKVYIGKIVSTHGIKGEIRILSDFPYKNKVYFRFYQKYTLSLFYSFKDVNNPFVLSLKEGENPLLFNYI